MKPLVVITGATGFVGKNLMLALPEDYQLRLVVAKSRKFVSERFTTLVPAEVTKEKWHSTTKVLHMAAARGAKSAKFKRKLEVDFTLKLAQKAIAEEVDSFIFLSCMASKNHQEVEGGLKELFAASQTKLVILKLPILYGPFCRGSMRLLFQLAANGSGLPLAGVGGPVNRLYVGNLVEVILTLLQNGKLEGLYRVTDDTALSLKEFYQTAFQHKYPNKSGVWPIGGGVIKVVAYLLQKLFHKLGLERTAQFLETLGQPQELTGKDFFQASRTAPKWTSSLAIKETAEWFASLEG